MSWKISTKTPVVGEGDKGATEIVFDVAWEGSVPRHLTFVGIGLHLADVTTDMFDDVRFENGYKLSSILIFPDQNGNLKGSFSVFFDGDTEVEADEIFSVELTHAFWQEHDAVTREPFKDKAVENVGEFAFGVIANDDPKQEVDVEAVVGRIRKRAEDGEIDSGIPGNLEEQIAAAKAEAEDTSLPGHGKQDGPERDDGPLKILEDSLVSGEEGFVFDFGEDGGNEFDDPAVDDTPNGIVDFLTGGSSRAGTGGGPGAAGDLADTGEAGAPADFLDGPNQPGDLYLPIVPLFEAMLPDLV